jgi:ketosteroid isomerase-like protein
MNNRSLLYRFLTFGFVFLLLAACNPPIAPSPSPTPSASLAPSTPTSSVTRTSAPPTLTPTPSVTATDQLIKGFAAAWAADDPDRLLSYYSTDVKSYDSTSGGLIYGYWTIDSVLHLDWANGAFVVNIPSYFVSYDGRFAATLGTFSQKDSSGAYILTPYVSLVEVSGDKLVWIYDYYGGISEQGLPMQSIPADANQPDATGQVVAATSSMVTAWEAAYNDKDTEAFLFFYADEAKLTQVIDPEWREFTKNSLEQEMTSQFASEKFVSQLADFFVSADGHFVAVQGTYDDAKTMDTPMVIILEVRDGKIIAEYDYLVYKAVF